MHEHYDEIAQVVHAFSQGDAEYFTVDDIISEMTADPMPSAKEVDATLHLISKNINGIRPEAIRSDGTHLWRRGYRTKFPSPRNPIGRR